jgi:hypothetical protein
MRQRKNMVLEERTFVAILLGAILFASPPALARSPPAPAGLPPAPVDSLPAPVSADADDEEVRERLRFIQRRLEGAATGARAWRWSWFSVYAVGLGVETYRGVTAHNRADQTDDWVSVGKAALGVVNGLAFPLHASSGAAELRDLPDATPDERLRKLQTAERLLRRNAAEARRAYTLLPHLLNLATNVLGGVIVWTVGHAPGQAGISTGLSVVLGEVTIWTQPTRAKRDLRDYERRIGGATPVESSGRNDPKLSLVPITATPLGHAYSAGVGLELRL